MSEQQPAAQERPIGQVTHYFSRVGVAAVQLSDTISVGEHIHIRGHTTDFVTDVSSMEIDNQPVTRAGPGASIGIKVPDKARPGDMVYRAH